jgi:gp6-like head-tail connector protein
MAALQIEVPPAAEAITLTDAKNYCRVEITDDDALITDLIVAAREAIEAFTGRSLVNKGYRQSLDSFPYYTDTVMSQMAYPPSYYSLPRYSTTLWNYSQMIKLLVSPLVSVSRISFLASADNQWHDMVAAPPVWYPETSYTASPAQSVTDGNMNTQLCITPGTSGHHPPIWSKVIGGITVESTGCQWQNQGPTPKSTFDGGDGEFGPFFQDFDSEPPRLFPGPPGQMWPSVLYAPNSVQIHFTAGYGNDGTNVPSVFKTAMRMCVSTWYENREYVQPGSFTELPDTLQRLLWSKRVLDYQPTRG